MTPPTSSTGYILHTRPFKETSALLECFCYQQGLVTVVARGVKRPRSAWYALAKPFLLLHLDWVGKGELKTLTQLEAQESITPLLSGNKIKLGLYLNELLIRLLQRLDPHPQLFLLYDQILRKIALSADEMAQQLCLRQFEVQLLAQLGYGLDLTRDGKSGRPIMPELLYSYDPSCGIFEIAAVLTQSSYPSVSGASIMALHEGKYQNTMQIRESKKLMRSILAHYLGNKPLHSRNLYAYVGPTSGPQESTDSFEDKE